ncbi:hypothetical protein AKJ16_DCAP12603 [Drosera capensis]
MLEKKDSVIENFHPRYHATEPRCPHKHRLLILGCEAARSQNSQPALALGRRSSIEGLLRVHSIVYSPFADGDHGMLGRSYGRARRR